jgi:MFS superfamily sulfate permease-like transporter
MDALKTPTLEKTKQNTSSFSLSFREIKSDLPAGLVVFLVALPLCLGIALASGAPLFSGIIAGIVGGIAVSLVSGSTLGVSGPAAGLTVIVLTSLQTLGSFQGFLVAVILAGVIQVTLGFLRAGIIAYYFPSSVIKGMLAAIGLLLIIKQIPHTMGFTGADTSEMGNHLFSDIFAAVQTINISAVIIASLSLAIILLMENPRIKKLPGLSFVPSALVAVVVATLVNELFLGDLRLTGKMLVELPVASESGGFLSLFTHPDFSFLSNPKVYLVAGTIAIVASIETLLCVEATDKLDPHKRTTPTNQELKAQGVGNIISGLLGGLPLTQVIVRSSANINAGAKTKAAALFHGLFLFICVLAIPQVLNKIPLSCLAAVLLVVGYKLTKVSLYKDMYRLGWEQFVPFVITVVAILATDLLKGIAIGMFFSIFYILRHNYRNPYFLKKDPLHTGSKKFTIILSDSVTFLNKGSILLTLNEIPENSEVTIDGSRSFAVDYDVLEVIYEFQERASLKNIKVGLIGI